MNTEIGQKLLSLVPGGYYKHLSSETTIRRDGSQSETVLLGIQAHTQDAVKAIREALPIKLWSKSNDGTRWKYNADYQGVKVQIYAVDEAPPTCKLVKEEITVTEQVPVKFEQRVVTKTVEKWICD